MQKVRYGQIKVSHSSGGGGTSRAEEGMESACLCMHACRRVHAYPRTHSCNQRTCFSSCSIISEVLVKSVLGAAELRAKSKSHKVKLAPKKCFTSY